ncbi:MAG: chorismate mutase [Oscillospiraceae bacterium]|nr:chorismate mutase [Oscillospiraceae bacterium]
MRNLEEIRQEINSIDKELLALFIKRMDCARDVGNYKKANNIPILNTDREQEILDRIFQQGGEYGYAAQLLYSNIMELSRALQHNIVGSGKEMKALINSAEKEMPYDNNTRVACQGIKGANNHDATLKIFPNCKPQFYKSFNDVFLAIENGEADYGVLPVENSSAGSVSDVYDLILKHRFYIVKSIDMPIHYYLCSIPQADKCDIEEVWSHPQALAQCSNKITENNYRSMPSANTAIAARDVANSKRIDIAAICNASAAKEYNLKVLEEHYENRGDNTTRFIVISKKLYIPEDAEKISLCFSLPHVTGSLYSVLCRFNSVGLNLTKIESRPMDIGGFEYLFYLDFSGNVSSESVLQLLCALSTELPEFSFLGNYNENKE